MQSSFVRTVLLIVVAAAAASVAFAASTTWFGSWYRGWANALPPVSDGYCNVVVVPLQGDIVAFDGDSLYYGEADESQASAPVATSGDWVERYIKDAEFDPNILGIVLQIDSYGGLAAPAYQMMNALKRSPLPAVAYIREVGTSAAYLAAMGADTVIASPFATVGSIGITYSYVENVEKNKQEGLRFVQLSSGPFKDIGNPNKPLSAEEKKLYERDLAVLKNTFVNIVAENRKLSIAEVEALADGSSMPSSIALEKKLVDSIGDEESIRAWFAGQYDTSPEDIVLCK